MTSNPAHTPAGHPQQHHLVVGAGGIGTGIAHRLADAGHRVTLASRSGRGAAYPGVTPMALDVLDTDALTAAARGCRSIVNAVNPASYSHWPRDWPPMAASFLAAAERSGVGLVIVGNLYGYGPVDGALTPDLPLAATSVKGKVRAQMWHDALAAHNAGRIRATELRASDYVGPGAAPRMSFFNEFVIGPAANGRPVRSVVGPVDVPHTSTYLPDIAALGAALAQSETGWGRAWHVPSPPPITIADLARAAATAAGRTPPKVGLMPGLALLRVVVPPLRELREMSYQFTRPFLVDARETEETFGLTATPWPEILSATVAALRR